MNVEIKDGEVLTVQTSVGKLYLRVSHAGEIWVTVASTRMNVRPLNETRIAITPEEK